MTGPFCGATRHLPGEYETKEETTKTRTKRARIPKKSNVGQQSSETNANEMGRNFSCEPSVVIGKVKAGTRKPPPKQKRSEANEMGR